jgi:hypothetical protein
MLTARHAESEHPGVENQQLNLTEPFIFGYPKEECWKSSPMFNERFYLNINMVILIFIMIYYD